MMPIMEPCAEATAADAREEAWFGSKRTPEKKPEVTMNAAVRERVDGYFYRRQSRGGR
jgi:hypothetical protein